MRFLIQHKGQEQGSKMIKPMTEFLEGRKDFWRKLKLLRKSHARYNKILWSIGGGGIATEPEVLGSGKNKRQNIRGSFKWF